jgi:hypothetical protein
MVASYIGTYIKYYMTFQNYLRRTKKILQLQIYRLCI